MASITIPVGGMSCAACQAHVQHALEAQPGVSSAVVNLMTGSAAVVFDPTRVQPDALVAAIRQTGYDADVPTSQRDPLAEQDARDRALDQEYRGLRTKAVIAGLGGIAAMVLSMPLMTRVDYGHGAGTPDALMRWAMSHLTAPLRAILPGLYALDPDAVAWALLGLTVVIMGWAGASSTCARGPACAVAPPT